MAKLLIARHVSRAQEEAEELEVQGIATNSGVMGQEHPERLTRMANIVST